MKKTQLRSRLFAGIISLSTVASLLVSCNVVNSTSSKRDAAPPKRDMVLWYNQPGETWYDAMLIGNGIMGTRVFGGIQDERIALNEGTFWSGRPHDYANPEGFKYFPKIRDLVFAEKFHEADVMADEHFFGIPKNQQSFQPLGDLVLSFSGIENVSDYYRELDMETGIA